MSNGFANYLNRNVHKDRIISTLPRCFHEQAIIDEKKEFDARTLEICRSHQLDSIGVKVCKMIIIGDAGVGKTSLVSRYCTESFNKGYKATIGVDFEIERFSILECPFTLQIWDTAGQERFQCIAAAYYRGAHVVAIVFDLANLQSLRNARTWLQSAMKENRGQNEVKLFLIGTKRDLVPDASYRFLEDEAIQIAKSIGAEYWATSALSGNKVREFFARVAALAFETAVLKAEENRTSGHKIDGDLVRPKPEDKKAERPLINCCKSG